MAKTTSDFFDQVFQVVRLIPKGRGTSYGAIANYLGAKSSSSCGLCYECGSFSKRICACSSGFKQKWATYW